jgi:amino acid transporter
MHLLDFILGRPLASSEDKEERVASFSGVSVFGLDALSSAAYGPEAALTVLIPLGVAGLSFGFPITVAVTAILLIVYFSYRQTIEAYPNGAGSYTVAKENLGRRAGLLAAVALLIDYTLNVAVGISAGIGALTSAIPMLQPYTLILCLLSARAADVYQFTWNSGSRAGFYATDLSVSGVASDHHCYRNDPGRRHEWQSPFDQSAPTSPGQP